MGATVKRKVVIGTASRSTGPVPPAETDHRFEPIYESCTFFVTIIEFRPVHERRRGQRGGEGTVARE
ncbi:hypothetical protein ATE80_14250 [Streptomyces kanasensis]|uniref:Uncharacterized protein n=1 Tax=Streptomyces kanasensis TaxID=936756 RepID=A0A100Y5N1_9ACTN|nr:hypothetical protein ATE80_14250 [Streptomyces kanasensis]